MDNKQIAHDIAVTLLPKLMEENGDNISIKPNKVYEINARNIRKHYQDIYSAVLSELSAE